MKRLTNERAANIEVVVWADSEALHLEAARRFVFLANQAIARHKRFYVALSGGSTPKGVYQLLAQPGWREQIEWEKVEIFFSDERAVSPRDKDSNFRMARESLLEHINISDANVHPFDGALAARGEQHAERAALDYETELRRAFAVNENELPRFCLILLGMGADAHTASLFPATAVVREQTKLAAHVFVEHLKAMRLTLTLPVINRAAHVVFLVTGADKAATLRRVLEGDASVDLPAQLVAPQDGKLTWLLDEAAASELEVNSLLIP